MCFACEFNCTYYSSGQFLIEVLLQTLVPGGRTHIRMKQTGMLVVSFRGVNFGFCSRLGCPGQSVDILSRQGLT